MTDFLAVPPAPGLAGSVRVPASKSGTNRALLAAALTAEPVEIAGPLESDDTAALRRCLEAMGASITPVPGGLRVRGPLGAPGRVRLDVRDSGTAARFLTAVAAAVRGRWEIDGSARLRQRPIGELVDALRSAGARIAYGGKDGCLPLSIEGGALRAGTAPLAVDASRSSQFLSAILIAAIGVDGGLGVRASGAIASAPYIGMTTETLLELGHEVVVESGTITVRRGDRPAPRYDVPGDYSSAVPLLAATVVAGGRIVLSGLRFPSDDADARALPVLEAMGLSLRATPEGIEASVSGGAPAAVTVRATDFPDAVPSLAAAAALAGGTSRFEGIGHLRLKESDRLGALTEILTSCGARAATDGDALVVAGPLAGGREIVRVGTHGDHRMAMAAAILSLKRPALLIENPDCVSKSYPAFFRDLERLRVR